MADFCKRCGNEIGFFSRKRAREPDGTIVLLCKTCAARRSDELSAPPPNSTPASPPPTPPAPPPPAAAPSPPPTGDPAGRIAQLLVKHFHRETGIDLLRDEMAMKRILDAARLAAVELRSAQATDVNLPFLTADATGPKHLQLRIDRTHV